MKSDLIRVFSCDRASIPCAPIRGSKILCGALVSILELEV
jgi:hypothetical protein